MANQPLQRIYGGADISAPTDSILGIRSIEGDAKRVDVWVADANPNGDTVFQVRKNGTIISAAEVTILQDETHGFAIFTEAVSDGDVLTLDADDVPSGGIASPVEWRVTVDDGISGGGGGLNFTTIFEDNFESGAIDSDKFSNIGGVASVVSEEIHSTTTTTQQYPLRTKDLINWFNKRLTLKMVPNGVVNANYACAVTISASDNGTGNGYTYANPMQMDVANGRIRLFTLGVQVLDFPHDAVNHIYFRLTFLLGVIMLEVSDDGMDWGEPIYGGDKIHQSLNAAYCHFRCFNGLGGSYTDIYDNIKIESIEL